MRKIVPILLVSVVWLFTGGGSVALADGMLLPLPEALNPDYVVVRYHHVTVHIEDSHAVTRVEQEFYNPYDFPVQGRYLFPVPPEAILSGFQATVDGQRQQVARQGAAVTNAALYAIVAQQHDPSLLRYADWETLAFDINLPPGGSRQMSLEYEEVLVPTGGLYRYRYLLSTERYSSQPLEQVSVTVDLQSSSGLASLYSSSHAVTTERLGAGRARVSWEAQDVRPTEDFELFFAPTERGFGGGLLTGQRNGHDHFLFLFSPQGEPLQTETLPKDIVFVIDRSGSMSGEKIEQARNALQFILGQLGKNDRFSIVSFDDGISVLSDTLQPVADRDLEGARRYVDRLSAGGSTDLEAALQAGLEILDRSGVRGASRMLVSLTDGLPTAGVTDGARIAHLVTETNTRLQARLHVFGVGYDVNTHLLDRLAADNGGTVTYVQPGESLELALTEFYGKIAHPLLIDVEVQFEGMQVSDLYPQAVPDLFQGSSLLLAGQYRAMSNAVSVRVRGRAGDEWREYVYHFDLDDTGDRAFVPRLWATRRLGVLLDRVRVEGGSRTLVNEIRDLGLSYGIVTPYTTFIIEGQSEGAASADNMALYDSAEVNQAWGKVTIQARVQNQAYQQASQANLAVGANVSNIGRGSLAQVAARQVDLSLLQGYKDLDGAITDEWIQRNVQVDRTVEFASEEYFALAKDPDISAFLQSGPNVLFVHQGQVISIQDPDEQAHQSTGPVAPLSLSAPGSGSRQQSHGSDKSEASRSPATKPARHAEVAPLGLLAAFVPVAAVGLLLGLVVGGAALGYFLRPRLG